MSNTDTEQHSSTVSDINLLAHFLADFDAEPLVSGYTVDTIVICASAVLHGAETIFRRLQDRTLIAKTLVLCGGIGHSTRLIWDAVAAHPEYGVLGDAVQGQPEARVLEMVLEVFFDVKAIRGSGCRVLVEDRSTNCGGNAGETRRVLEAEDDGDGHGHGSGATTTIDEATLTSQAPKQIMIVQDPTMALRTRASFEKVYSDLSNPPTFISFPVFVPKVESSTYDQTGAGAGVDLNTVETTKTQIKFSAVDVPATQLWDMNRFVELLMGEIPRLRNDENGYGPQGRGFIAHVEVPQDVEDAWNRLRDQFSASR